MGRWRIESPAGRYLRAGTQVKELKEMVILRSAALALSDNLVLVLVYCDTGKIIGSGIYHRDCVSDERT